MTELLRQFPAAWIVIGTLISGAIFYFANRKVFALQSSAATQLAGVYKETITALQKERDDYRDKLHQERNSKQGLVSELELLKSRPDLTTMHSLLKDQSTVMRTIGETIMNHVNQDAQIFEKINQSMAKIPMALDKASEAFDKRQKAVMDVLEMRTKS